MAAEETQDDLQIIDADGSVDIDFIDTDQQADKLIARMDDMSDRELRALSRQVQTRNPIREKVSKAAAEALDRRIAGLRKEREALLSYRSSSELQVGGFRGLGAGRSVVLLVLLLAVAAGSWRGGVYVETQANASASVTTIELVDSFLELDANGMRAYEYLPDDIRAKMRESASDEQREQMEAMEREWRSARGGGR